MTSRWRRALVAKELRALGPTWLAFAVAALCGLWVQRGSSVLAYVVGAFVLGALSLGHEYTSRTLPSLLSQPIGRRQILVVKALVLVALIMALAAVASFAGFADITERWSPSAGALPRMRLGLSTFLLLPTLAAVCLAPWFTMLGRGPLAGLVFSIATLALTWLAGDLVGIARFGLSQNELVDVDAFRTHVMWWSTLILCAAGAGMTWRAFMRLEAADVGSALALPRRHTRIDPATDADRAAAHPGHWARQLVRKELHLQKMVFAIAGLYMLVWCAVAWSRQFVPATLTLPLAPITLLYAATVSVLVGAFASAEERQLGTLSWQLLMPVPAWRQWAVKVLVAGGLSVLLGFALPRALESITPAQGGLDDVQAGEAMLSLLGLTVASLYVSSAIVGGLRALVASMVVAAPVTLFVGGLLALFTLASDVALGVLQETGWYRTTYHRELAAVLDRRGVDTVALIATIGLALVLLRLALLNHRSADSSVRRVCRQMAWTGAWIAVVAIGVGSLHAASLDNWRITGSSGVRVRGHVEFDGTATRPRRTGCCSVWLRHEDTRHSTEAGGDIKNDWTFTTTYSQPGPHLIWVFALDASPWALKSVTLRGRDVSETPIELSSDVDDVVITLSDHLGTIEGTVVVPATEPPAPVGVMVFPADPKLWTNDAVMIRRSGRVWLPSPREHGNFRLDMPPDGDYFLVAFHEPPYRGWPLVAQYAGFALIADRIEARAGTVLTRTLVVKQ